MELGVYSTPSNQYGSSVVVTPAPDGTGLKLYSDVARWVSLPVFTFPTSGVFTVTARFYLNKPVGLTNRAIFTLTDGTNAFDLSIDLNGTSRLIARSEESFVSVAGPVLQQGNEYVIACSINLTSGLVTLDIGGAQSTDVFGDGSVASMRGFTTVAGDKTSIGNKANTLFMDAVFYELNINGSRIYSTEGSNTSSNEVTDSEGGVAGVIQNPSVDDSQWITNPNLPIIVVTPISQTITVGDTAPVYTATIEDINGNAIVGTVIVTGDTIDVNTVGTYNTYFNFTDTEGNVAVQVTRVTTVEAQVVVDTTPPVITLVPSNLVYNVQVNGTFTPPVATSTDNIDNAKILTPTGIVDTGTIGTYTLTYTDTDSAGNVATPVIVTVNVVAEVVDSIPPVITLTPSTLVYNLTEGDVFNYPVAISTDDNDNPKTLTPIGTVDSNTAGIYTLTYTDSDQAGNIATPVVVTVNVAQAPDITPPVINVSGNAVTTLRVGKAIPQWVVTVTDNKDSGLVAIESGDTIDNQVAGTYVRRWNISDSAGNDAIEVTRTVIYEALTDIPDLPTESDRLDIIFKQDNIDTGYINSDLSFDVDIDTSGKYGISSTSDLSDAVYIISDRRDNVKAVKNLSDGVGILDNNTLRIFIENDDISTQGMYKHQLVLYSSRGDKLPPEFIRYIEMLDILKVQ